MGLGAAAQGEGLQSFAIPSMRKIRQPDRSPPFPAKLFSDGNRGRRSKSIGYARRKRDRKGKLGWGYLSHPSITAGSYNCSISRDP